MSKPIKSAKASELAAEYDFRRGVRGKYAHRYAQGTNVVVLEPDVAEVFHSPGEVNEALRGRAALIRRRTKPAAK
ncbi:MAG TPA: hypothetical protein VM100_07590 [Longimicrobiales bacterium]|nr:hypothetical protein [Longimicrobiales bacterium]